MAAIDLTAQRLRELLDYDPETGALTWRARPARTKCPAGAIAGCVAPDGYIVIGIDGGYHKAHRLAWLHSNGAWPMNNIDHINGIRSDNRLCNLRDVTRFINCQNIRKAPVNNKAGLLGVRKYRKSWRASIMVDGLIRHLGTFQSPEAAHEAYVLAKRQFHPGNTL